MKLIDKIEQAKIDFEKYRLYLEEMETINLFVVRKSFKELFRYEIILYIDGGFGFREDIKEIDSV